MLVTMLEDEEFIKLPKEQLHFSGFTYVLSMMPYYNIVQSLRVWASFKNRRCVSTSRYIWMTGNPKLTGQYQKKEMSIQWGDLNIGDSL